MVIIVGFQRRVGSSGLGWLKRGFRHCFVYQRSSDAWVLCDPLSRGILLQSATGLSVRTLLTSLAALETSAVCIEPADDNRALPWLRPLTCVEICKRLARRRAARIMTPYQLFSALLRPARKGLTASTD